MRFDRYWLKFLDYKPMYVRNNFEYEHLTPMSFKYELGNISDINSDSKIRFFSFRLDFIRLRIQL